MARKMAKNKTFYESKILMHGGGITGFIYTSNNNVHLSAGGPNMMMLAMNQ